MKSIRSISIENVDDGGHIVTHSFHQTGRKYIDPKRFAFAKDDAEEMVGHVRRYLPGAIRKGSSMKKSAKKSNPFGKRPGASVASPMKSMGKKGAY